MPAPLHLSGPCEVCGQPAHGRHFGVVSCRACAAFFRRAARVNSISQGIVCENGNCTVSISGIFFCKPCRLKKCYEMGMDSSKIQIDRDLISSSLRHSTERSKLSTPQSLANFLGRPELILMCEPDKASTSKTIIDISFLVDKAVRIFQEPLYIPSPCQFDNSLERMTHALDILKTPWLLWTRLDKQTETAHFHRMQFLSGYMYMVGEGRCINTNNFEIDLSFCTNYSMDQIRTFVTPDIDNTWKLSVGALVQLEPTNVELNFMFIQLCLSDVLKKCSSENARSIEKLLATQADNLHDYYTRKMKTPNYSGRLTKMMKVIQYIEADVRAQREKVHLAKVFDIFNIEFSHPEMFEIF